MNLRNPLTILPWVNPFLGAQLSKILFLTYSTLCRNAGLISFWYKGFSMFCITCGSVEGGGSVSASNALKKLRMHCLIPFCVSSSVASSTRTYIVSQLLDRHTQKIIIIMPRQEHHNIILYLMYIVKCILGNQHQQPGCDYKEVDQEIEPQALIRLLVP